MYFFDFLKHLFKKSNIGTIIWMTVNLIVICGTSGVLCGAIMESDPAIYYGIAGGFLIYILSLAISFSPIGEWLLRRRTGCKPITDQNINNYILPIFNEVYSRAKAENPELPDDIKLFISNDKDPNAFATGRHTVCITTGLFQLDADDIRGILGHEFGHLAHKDTDRLIAISLGNLFVTIIFSIFGFFVRAITRISTFCLEIASDSLIVTIINMLLSFLVRFIVDLLLVGLMALWTKIGVLICMASSRGNEYEADAYSYSLGYGDMLAGALGKLDGSKTKMKLWAAINSSHPATADRIARLYQLKDTSTASSGNTLPQRDRVPLPPVNNNSVPYYGNTPAQQYPVAAATGNNTARAGAKYNPATVYNGNRQMPVQNTAAANYNGRQVLVQNVNTAQNNGNYVTAQPKKTQNVSVVNGTTANTAPAPLRFKKGVNFPANAQGFDVLPDGRVRFFFNDNTTKIFEARVAMGNGWLQRIFD